MVHKLLVEYDDVKLHTNIELPDNAIVAAGLAEIARAAILHHKIAPLVVPKIQPATLMPHEVPHGQA